MRVGVYELLEVIGRGGMATVHRARNVETDQIVAVKMMTAHLANDATLLRRFEQEFAAASRLRHPHIVRGLDFGVQDECPYLVMEYVEGQDLGRRVLEQGPLPEAEAVLLLSQVGTALGVAHRNNLIHRDVKPENVLLTQDGQAKLTDLGLSKDLDSSSAFTRSRTCLGTAAYMAPEQFEDARHANIRSDVYSLGATLYFALTGIAPFRGRGNLSVMRRKLKNEFTPPRQLVPTLRPDIDRSICQALDAFPARRQRSCDEFVAQLAAARPADASEPSADRVEERRLAQRHPTDLTAACRALKGSAVQWLGEVLDISLSGMRIQLDRHFEPGVVLNVTIGSEEVSVSVTRLIQVRWVRGVGGSRWLIGAAFSRPLTEGELSPLIEHKPATEVIHAEEK
jgi:eukaryotic-like serine/threonine-protein kinase